MAQRPKQPFKIELLIIVLALLLALTNLASDINAPLFFIIKAGLQPVSAALLIIFLAYTLYIRSKLITMATLTACFLSLPVLLPKISLFNPSTPINNNSLITATFSTLTRTQNVNDIVKFLLTEKPDLACLQEVSKEHRGLLIELVSKEYQYKSENNNNQLILSRYPLNISKDAGYYLTSKLTHPELGIIRVINAHMPRPYLTSSLTKSWKQLLEDLDSKQKTILCGDLNITPNNSLYDFLRYDYNFDDALMKGYGFTYPNAERRSAILGPFIRIDYILTRGFSAHGTKTVNASTLSDHRAVVTHLSLSTTKQ